MPRPPSERQHGHAQVGSKGRKSDAKEACRRLRFPWGVMALPKRWGCNASVGSVVWYKKGEGGA